MFAQRGYFVVGQDLAPAMIELANENKRRSGLGNLGFVVADYEVLDYRDEFDCAVFLMRFTTPKTRLPLCRPPFAR